MSCAIIGEGEVRLDGEKLEARDALKRIGAEPVVLGPKEGLALLNGTQISTALALDALFRARDVFDAALVAGAMSTDAMKGTDAPFDARIQKRVAKRVRSKLRRACVRSWPAVKFASRISLEMIACRIRIRSGVSLKSWAPASTC